MRDVTDEELDVYIRTRLRLLGVDLDVLPVDDVLAPVDLQRVMASARNFLRSTPHVIRNLDLGMEGSPPEFYPTPGLARNDGEDGS